MQLLFVLRLVCVTLFYKFVHLLAETVLLYVVPLHIHAWHLL